MLFNSDQIKAEPLNLWLCLRSKCKVYFQILIGSFYYETPPKLIFRDKGTGLNNTSNLIQKNPGLMHSFLPGDIHIEICSNNFFFQLRIPV